MAVHASHMALPYPIKGARYSFYVPYLDADGDPTAPGTPDTEITKDNAAAADATEEVSATSGMDGIALFTITGDEADCSGLSVNAKVATGPKATLGTLYPRNLPSLSTGTLTAGGASGGTLQTILPYDITNCFFKTTGGTGGGGGSGSLNNQARRIATYNTSTGAFTVTPDFETSVSTDTTYAVLLPEGMTPGQVKGDNNYWQGDASKATTMYTAATNSQATWAAMQLLVAHHAVIGATGNDTTHVHLSGLTYADDEINGYILMIEDINPASEIHWRVIRDWDGTSKLATVDTLPFTPEASTDEAALLMVPGIPEANLTQINGVAQTATLDDIEAQTDDIGVAGAGLTALATAAELAKVPKSDGSASWNATALAAIQSEANDALVAYDPPTNAELTTAQTAIIDGVLDGVRVRKNTELASFPFRMVSATDHVTGATGLTVTATRTIDGAAFGACANSVSEISGGWYKITFAAADLNGNTIGVNFAASGADTVGFTFVTQETD
jgi:hypothetical protein